MASSASAAAYRSRATTTATASPTYRTSSVASGWWSGCTMSAVTGQAQGSAPELVAEVGAAERGDHAGPLQRGADVDPVDPGVRDRAAQDRQVQQAGQLDVVGPAGPAGDQPAVLLALAAGGRCAGWRPGRRSAPGAPRSARRPGRRRSPRSCGHLRASCRRPGGPRGRCSGSRCSGRGCPPGRAGSPRRSGDGLCVEQVDRGHDHARACSSRTAGRGCSWKACCTGCSWPSWPGPRSW